MKSGMGGLSRVELSRMLATPLVTIGTLGAILVWEFENVGSEAAAALIASCAIGAAVVVATGLRERILKVSQHYEALLATADDQSRRAESASRVKDEFLATLSHELRTPLNSVLGWARLLTTGKLNEAQTAQAIAAIERAGWAQSNLIENLLDASRMVEGKLSWRPGRPWFSRSWRARSMRSGRQPNSNGSHSRCASTRRSARCRWMPTASIRSSGIWSRMPSSSRPSAAA